MPWYEADPARDFYGWHWTMNHFHPRAADAKPEAASHYTPLLGLYDGGDPDTLECQVLLMKLSGIDGVIVDWYGTDDYLDYGAIHRNTLRLIPYLKRASLRYAIMYEDQTVPKLLEAHRLPGDDAAAHGAKLLGWMQGHWFTDPAYLTQNGRPVFLTFGNGYYTTTQWNQIFASVSPAPRYFTEAHARPPAVGAFDWPQPASGTDAGLKNQRLFCDAAKTSPAAIPVAFPRFDDIYETAGQHKSWGHIADRNGATYTSTLEAALKSGASVIQIATWNDWGEGTQIEPSAEFGYRDLEETQRLRRSYIDPHFSSKPADLPLPVALYRLRKKYKGDAAKAVQLDAVSRLLFAGKMGAAKALLDRFAL